MAVTAATARTADADVTNTTYMRTAIVILNWNTEGFLEKFLPPLLSSVSNIDGAEVIVADNASTDGSLRVMKEKFPHVRTIAFDTNHGFTGGYNRALAEIEAEYYVLLNSDVEVTEGWLQPLIDWMEANPDCGICAPKIFSWHDKTMLEYAGGAGGHIDSYGYTFCRGRIMGMTEADNGQYDKYSNKVFWVSGACLMIRSGLYHELGGLDERFFAHMDEVDLCWRLQLHGYSVCVVGDSAVYHVGGGTLPSSSPYKLFLNFRNNLLMLNKNSAKTLALMYSSMGFSPEVASATAMDKADRRILRRMNLDILASLVYLVTFRFKAFCAVWKALHEYKKMRDRILLDDVINFVNRTGKSEINGIYRKSVISRALFYGRKVFQKLEDKDFIKYHVR